MDMLLQVNVNKAILSIMSAITCAQLNRFFSMEESKNTDFSKNYPLIRIIISYYHIPTISK